MRTIAPVLLTLGPLLGCSSHALHLAAGGRTSYRIVVGAGADGSTRAVAADMAGLLGRMTGATFAIVSDETAPSDFEIVLGHDNARIEALGLEQMTRGFASGEYAIRTVGQRLVIGGAPPRGTINGIYGFLQDHLGCRWFTPGCTVVPRHETVRLGAIDDTQKPSIRWRSAGWSAAYHPDWFFRNRLSESMDGSGRIENDPRGGTVMNNAPPHFMLAINRDVLKSHPQYMGERDGKRKFASQAASQVYCLTNDGLADHVARWLSGVVPDRPGPRRINIGLGDTADSCQCSACRAAHEKLGTTGTYITFVNKVAERIAVEHPNTLLDALAYFHTNEPGPVKPHPIVRVMWASVQPCTGHAFDEPNCAVNARLKPLENLAQWRRDATTLHTWYYLYRVTHWLPAPGLFAMARTMKSFSEVGIDAFFLSSAGVDRTRRNAATNDGDLAVAAYGNAPRNGYFTTPVSLEHVRAYIAVRLMWDADFDVAAGIREFCEVYYGPAVKQMVRYVTAVESSDSYDQTIESTMIDDPGVHSHYLWSARMSSKAVEALSALLVEALGEVADEPVHRRRVQMAQMTMDAAVLAYLPRDHMLWQGAFERFFALAEELQFRDLPTYFTPLHNRLKVSFPKYREFLLQKSSPKTE